MEYVEKELNAAGDISRNKEFIHSIFSELNLGSLLTDYPWLTLNDITEFSKCLKWTNRQWFIIIPLLTHKNSRFTCEIYKEILRKLIDNKIVKESSFIDYEFYCVNLWKDSPKIYYEDYIDPNTLKSIHLKHELSGSLHPLNWFFNKIEGEQTFRSRYLNCLNCPYCKSKQECFMKNVCLGECSTSRKKSYCNVHAGIHLCETHSKLVLQPSYYTLFLQVVYKLSDGRKCTNLENYKRLCERYHIYTVNIANTINYSKNTGSIRNYLPLPQEEDEQEQT